MNYLILNGKRSTLIRGLLIQSLPSISKPLMRTQIDEIDGRDGDIVTKLGYSAYDKTVTIGLYGDYDINAIIAYFASEGEVIFSNEADKYYRYTIIAQIDFEKLIRFKTATVTFHVQPYKYSAVDRAVTFTGQTATIANMGNTTSRPSFTINGAGVIELYVNGYQALVIDLGDQESITIDAEKMEAYKDGLLKNRLVTGNYDDLAFNAGVNTVSWTGDVDSVDIANYSRWI